MSGKKRIRAAIDEAAPASPPVDEAASSSSGAPDPSSFLASLFEMRPAGLYRKGGNDGKGSWISGPFNIEAQTRDGDQQDWGLLLSWRDFDGVRHEEAFPRSMFAGECGDLRARLAAGGLRLNAAAWARTSFSEYLNIVGSPLRARSVARVGWHVFGDRRVFVLPARTFGEAGERVVLQTGDREPSLYQQGGTLQSWREQVSRLCNGNSRLILAVSCAFAAPLLGLIGEDGGGFHFRGNSRLGKSTALRVAASVCGGTPGEGVQGYVRQWRATGNALEAVAGAHCDGLLALDEMGQVDAREAGEIAYMFANGTGKARSSRTGQARATLRFRVLFLSTGEIGLDAKNAEAGKATKAGQEVRLVDVPADAGAGFGLFEDLHDEYGAAAFAQALRDATRVNFGSALPAFLETVTKRLADRRSSFADEIAEQVGGLVARWLERVPGAGGQVRSVASRFALAAVAGELAIRWLIVEWPPGEAERGAEACFRAWLADRGTAGAREDAQAVGQLRAFIVKHGDSRFLVWRDRAALDAQAEADESLPPPERFRTVQAAGWKRWEKSVTGAMAWRYYLTAEGLKEALAGLPQHESRQVLTERGFIAPPDGAADQKRRNKAGVFSVPGHGKVRLYRIGDGLLESTEGDG